MSFTWLNKQGVKSSNGFVVQRTGRFTAEYIENSNKITIDLQNGELPNEKFCEIINSDSFEKWDNGTPISSKKQDEILQNFKEAMEFQGITIIVQE